MHHIGAAQFTHESRPVAELVTIVRMYLMRESQARGRGGGGLIGTNRR